MISGLANHLWQSTLFALAAALLAFSVRKHRASVRYSIWVAASVKFLMPFALLIGAGRQAPVPMRFAALAGAKATAAVEMADGAFTIPAAPRPEPQWQMVLLAVWALGSIAVTACRIHQWRRAAANPATEPGVFGIFRPKMILPAGIEERLTPEQLRAVIAHETCHIERRDNLLATVHMAVEALFWFHPLVWWIGARLVEERERACDEEVLRRGADPQAYASGILEVCKLYLESPMACISGVTGADLKRRIAAIMAGPALRRLPFARKAMLAGAAAAAVAIPILMGVVHAQSDTFEVASVKPAGTGTFGVRMQFTPGGGVRILNGPLINIIMMAYDVERFQISGAPAWLDSEQYVIEAKGPGRTESPGQTVTTASETEIARRRLKALLAERFHLAAKRDTKEGPVYVLTVGRHGHKLSESATGFEGVKGGPGRLKAEQASMELLARFLSISTGRPVLDRTGLKGTYAFELEWTPDPSANPAKGILRMKEEAAAAANPPDPNGPTIFTAVQEQLGLRLEPARGPVETIVIKHIERPTAN